MNLKVILKKAQDKLMSYKWEFRYCFSYGSYFSRVTASLYCITVFFCIWFFLRLVNFHLKNHSKSPFSCSNYSTCVYVCVHSCKCQQFGIWLYNHNFLFWYCHNLITKEGHHWEFHYRRRGLLTWLNHPSSSSSSFTLPPSSHCPRLFSLLLSSFPFCYPAIGACRWWAVYVVFSCSTSHHPTNSCEEKDL